jgi:hypothetical protein
MTQIGVAAIPLPTAAALSAATGNRGHNTSDGDGSEGRHAGEGDSEFADIRPFHAYFSGSQAAIVTPSLFVLFHGSSRSAPRAQR